MLEGVAFVRLRTSETNWVNSEYSLPWEVRHPGEEEVGRPRAKLTTSTVDCTSCSLRDT